MKKTILFSSLLAMLLPTMSVWGSTYYYKMHLKVSSNSTGKGLVYAKSNTTELPSGATFVTETTVTHSRYDNKSVNTGSAFAKANYGYVFKGWSSSDNSTTYVSTDNPYTPVVSSSATKESSAATQHYYAVFEDNPNSYTLVLNKPEGLASYTVTAPSGFTADLSQGGSATVYKGDQYSFKYNRSSDEYDFINWTVNGEQKTGNPVSVTISGNTTVVLTLKKKVTYTATCQGSAGGTYKANATTVSGSDQTISNFGSVTVNLSNPVANNGYAFYGWYKLYPNGVKEYLSYFTSASTGEMKENIVIGAEFREVQDCTINFIAPAEGKITYAISGGNSGEVDDADKSETVLAGADVTLTATCDYANRRAKWYTKDDSGEKVYFSIDKSLTRTFASSVTLGVDFIPVNEKIVNAIEAAQSSSSHEAILAADAEIVLDTSIEIPSGIKIDLDGHTLYVDGTLNVNGTLVNGTVSKCLKVVKQTGADGMVPINPYGSVKYWKTDKAVASTASVTGWSGTPGTHLTVMRGDGVAVRGAITSSSTLVSCTFDGTVAVNHVKTIGTASTSTSISDNGSYILLADGVTITGPISQSNNDQGYNRIANTATIDCASFNCTMGNNQISSNNGSKLLNASAFTYNGTYWQNGAATFYNCPSISIKPVKNTPPFYLYDSGSTKLEFTQNSSGTAKCFFYSGKFDTDLSGNGPSWINADSKIYGGGFKSKPDTKWIEETKKSTHTFSQHSDGYWYLDINQDPNVASISGTKYLTIEEALDYLENNAAATITLLRNVRMESAYTLEAGKSLVIELNGCHIDAPNGFVKNYGSLSIRDNNNSLAVCGVTVGSGSNIIENYDNGTADICYGLYNGNFAVNGGTFTTHHGKFIGSVANNGGTVNLKGGVFSSDVSSLMNEGYHAFAYGGWYYVGRFPKPEEGSSSIASFARVLTAMPAADKTLYLAKKTYSLTSCSSVDEWKRVAELKAAYVLYDDEFNFDILVGFDQDIAANTVQATVDSKLGPQSDYFPAMNAGVLERIFSPRITQNPISYKRFIYDNGEGNYDTMEAGVSAVNNANAGTACVLAMDLWKFHDKTKTTKDSYLTILALPYVFGAGNNVAMIRPATGTATFKSTLQGAIDVVKNNGGGTVMLANNCNEIPNFDTAGTYIVDSMGFEHGFSNAEGGYTVAEGLSVTTEIVDSSVATLNIDGKAVLPDAVAIKYVVVAGGAATAVDAPTAVSGLVYDGTVKTGVAAGTGYTLSGNTATAAGSYTATATLEDGYVWSDDSTDTKTISWSIGKASLTATAENKSVIRGETVPYTVSYSGFVNGDSAASITAPTASCAYNPADLSATTTTYPISLSGGSAANYAITLVPGTLTVHPCVATTEVNGETSHYESLAEAIADSQEDEIAITVTSATTEAVSLDAGKTLAVTVADGVNADVTVNPGEGSFIETETSGSTTTYESKKITVEMEEPPAQATVEVVKVDHGVTNAVSDASLVNEAVHALTGNHDVSRTDNTDKLDVLDKITVTPTKIVEEVVYGDTIIRSATFDVVPHLHAGQTLAEGQMFKFRLPVDAAATQLAAIVYHAGAQFGIYPVQTYNEEKFVEVESADFSPYGYELLDGETTNPIAAIGTTGYATLDAAIAAASNGDMITVFPDTFNIGSDTVVVNKSVTITGYGKDDTILNFTATGKAAFSIQASNVTIENMTINQEDTGSYNTYHIGIDAAGSDACYSNVTISNLKLGGGKYSMIVYGESFTIDGCDFASQGSSQILVDATKGNSRITNNTFTGGKYNVLQRNSHSPTTVTSSGKLTISDNTSQNGNLLYILESAGSIDTTQKMELVITGNEVANYTNKAVALTPTDELGKYCSAVTVTNNAFHTTTANRPVIQRDDSNRTTLTIDASANYWGGSTPDFDNPITEGGSKYLIMPHDSSNIAVESYGTAFTPNSSSPGATVNNLLYKVTFVDENGTTVLYETNVASGNAPVYGGTTPTKAATAQNTFTWRGWTYGGNSYGTTDTLAPVTGTQTYTATYSSTVNDYTVTVTIPANTTITVKQNGVAISPDAGTDNEFTVPYGTDLTVEYAASGAYIASGTQSQVVTVDSTKTVAAPNDYSVALAVAQIVTNGGATTNKYESLAEAVAAASAGDTITLLTNVELDEAVDIAESVTLDLNGKTVSISEANEDGYAISVSSGTVTITGNGAIDAGDDIALDVAGGSVTIANGTFSVIGVDDGSLTITDGTFNGGLLTVDGTTIINGGTFNDVVDVGGGAVTINNGAFTAADNVLMVTDAEGTLTVNGGTFAATQSEDGEPIVVYVEGGAATLTGGTFTGGTIATDEAETGTLTVSGGFFSSMVPEEYCANGYIPTAQNSETGLYSVTQGAYYDVWVGGTQLSSLNAADVFGDGKVSYDDATKTLTLNGYTYSGAGYDSSAVYIGDMGGATFNIVVAGENSLTSTATYGYAIRSVGTGAVTVTGSGANPSLALMVPSTYDTGYAVSVKGTSATFKDLSMAVTGYLGFVVNGNNAAGDALTIDNCDITFAGTAMDQAVYVQNREAGEATLRIVGSALTGAGSLLVHGENSSGCDADVWIEDSEINLTGAYDDSRHGIEVYSSYGDATLVITNCNSVTIASENAEADAVSVIAANKIGDKGSARLDIVGCNSVSLASDSQSGVTVATWDDTNATGEEATINILRSTVEIVGDGAYGLQTYGYGAGETRVSIIDSEVDVSANWMAIQLGAEQRFSANVGEITYAQTNSEVYAFSLETYGLTLTTLSTGRVNTDASVKAIISGGLFDSTGAVVVQCDDPTNAELVMTDGAEVNIDSSTATETEEDAILTGGKLTIDSGKYSFSYPDGLSAATNTVVGNITGGIFTEDVSDLCAEGYIAVDNTDAETKDAYPYMVRAAEYVAQIVRGGEVIAKYETFTNALEVAESGDTVQLLANVEDVTETFVLHSKNITIDGQGLYSITAGENTEPRSVVQSYGGARNMFVVQSGNVTFKDITLDGGETHYYTFLVQAKNGTTTFDNVSLLNGGEADTSGTAGVGYGAAVQVDGATVLVTNSFYACTGTNVNGVTTGVFPFTALLYQSGAIGFDDGVDVDIGGDLLLVGMVGAVDVSTDTGREEVEAKLVAMNVPDGFYPYTLKVGDDALTSFTGASPLGWNGIIDYGREIMTVADSLGMEMDPDTTPVETGLLSDTVLPETFTFEDGNFTVNGNGYALSGTIEYTDDAGILENIVLGTEEDPLVLDMTGLSEGNAIHLGSDIAATSVVIKVTEEQATSMGHAIVTWDAAHETEEEAETLETGILVEIVNAQGEPILDPATNEPREASVIWDIELGVAYIGPCEARLTGPTHEKAIYTTLADAIARAANSGDTVTLLMDIQNFTGTQDISKSLTLDGAGHTIAAAPVSEHRDVVNAWAGSTSMFKLQTGDITFRNITLDGDATHAYTFLISGDNSSVAITTENVRLIHGGEISEDSNNATVTPGNGYGAAIHLNNGAQLVVSNGFYACTGTNVNGVTTGVFPFTAILPENLEAGTAVAFELTGNPNDPANVDIGDDLLLVGMIGDLIDQYGIDAVQDILDYMKVPSRFIPYTLTLADGSAYAFTGASPRRWNEIIDYGKDIMDVATANGFSGLNKETTPVEVGLATDTVLPAGADGDGYDFLYEDSNFSVNGNGNALSGTIKFTDDADGGMLRDIVLGTDENPLTLDLSATDNPIDLGDGVIIEDVVVLMTEEQAKIGKIVFDWDTTDELPPDDEQGVRVTVVDDDSGEPTGETKELVWDEDHGIAYIGPCEARLTDADGGNPVYTTLAIAFASATNGCTVSLMTNVTYAAQTAATLVFDHVGATVTFDLNGFTFGSDLATQLEVEAGTLALVDSDYPAGDGGLFATNTAFQVDSGATLTIASGIYVGDFSNSGTVAISGGRFSDPVPQAHCAEGYIPATLNEAVNPYTVVPGGFLVTVASVSNTSLGLDLVDMASYDGYDIHYELRRGNTTIQRGDDPAAFEIPLYPDDRNDSRNPSGIYRIVALMVPQFNPAVTNEIPSTNAVGVLKVTSSLTNTVAAVPWTALASNPAVATNVAVSTILHPANLSAGDRLLSFNYESGNYYGWTRTGTGTAATWAPMSVATVDGIQVTPAPENWRPAPGSAFWLTRETPCDATGARPFFLYGQLPAGDYAVTLAGGSSSLCANPTASAVTLDQLSFQGEIGADDTIVLTGDGAVSTIYVRNKSNTAWGRWRKTVSRGMVTSTWTEDGSIAPGSGFWYNRRSSGDISLVWPGWEE